MYKFRPMGAQSRAEINLDHPISSQPARNGCLLTPGQIRAQKGGRRVLVENHSEVSSTPFDLIDPVPSTLLHPLCTPQICIWTRMKPRRLMGYKCPFRIYGVSFEAKASV